MKSSIKQNKYYNQNKDNEEFKLRIAIRNRENYLKRKLKSQSLKQLNISDNQDSNIIVNKLEINETIEPVNEIILETKAIEPISNNIIETKPIEPVNEIIPETKPIEQTIINILKTPENNELLKTIENDSDNENDLEFNNTIDIIKNIVKEIAIQKLNEDLDLKRQSKYYDNQLKHFKNKGFNNADIKPINKIYNNTTPKNDNINLFKTKRNLRQIIKNLKPKTLKRIITHFT